MACVDWVEDRYSAEIPFSFNAITWFSWYGGVGKWPKIIYQEIKLSGIQGGNKPYDAHHQCCKRILDDLGKSRMQLSYPTEEKKPLVV